jgi:crotonobetainyl-CoA:carnitine CoA-transferase CaiB-like acyl-CoA transferase
MTAPLEGLRVVDSTNGRGELCGRLLADLGADVVLVEPPDGSALRTRFPRTPDGTQSLAFAWRNANKRGMVIDTGTEVGRDRLLALLAGADVWIESADPGSEPDPAAVAAALPHLVVTSITAFGHTGPLRDAVADDDVLAAWSGAMFKAGVAHKDPLLPPTPMATDVASVTAAVATLLAVHQRLVTGRGQHVDLAVQSAAAAATDWSYSNASVMREAGRPYNEVRNGGGFMYPIFRCRDGWVRMVILAPRQWHAMWRWMGEPPEFADDFWAQVGNRIMNADVLNLAYEAFFADKAMLEICTEGQHRGIVVTPLLRPDEVLADSHLNARGTFVDAEIAPGVDARFVSGFVEIDGERRGFRHRAPALGEHDDIAGFEVAMAALASTSVTTPAGDTDTAPVAPLAGLRVLDFGIGGVGVECSRLLGEYGADVIKMETRTYPDFIRLVALTEMSPSFASSSRSKRSLGINVKLDQDLALIRRLVAQADVVVDNSATGTMASLGLGADDLRTMNPRVVVVSSQLVGSRGPNAHWTGYGPTTQTYGGLLHLWDYDDDDPPATNQTIYPDHLAGRLCAMGAVAGLIRRADTGEGCHVEVAQIEAVVNMLGERLAEEHLAPGTVHAAGNRHPDRAPRGPYPCAGEQQWVVISVRDDTDWSALRRALGDPEWAARPEWAAAAGRIADSAAIDRHLTEWTATRDRAEVVDILQAAGVPCGPMITGTDMLDDPQLESRGWTLDIDQPGVGPMKLEGPAWLSSAMAGPITFPAPGLGQHTREIAAELLGLDDDEIDALVAAGVLEVDA